MAEPVPEDAETEPTIEVGFLIKRAARVVKEINLIPRFMLHEGKKQVSELWALRATLEAELVKIAAEKGITT